MRALVIADASTAFFLPVSICVIFTTLLEHRPQGTQCISQRGPRIFSQLRLWRYRSGCRGNTRSCARRGVRSWRCIAMRCAVHVESRIGLPEGTLGISARLGAGLHPGIPRSAPELLGELPRGPAPGRPRGLLGLLHTGAIADKCAGMLSDLAISIDAPANRHRNP